MGLLNYLGPGAGRARHSVERNIRPPLLVYLVASIIVTMELGAGGDKAVKGAWSRWLLSDPNDPNVLWC